MPDDTTGDRMRSAPGGEEPFEAQTTDERLLGLLRYWRERRGGRKFPARRDIDPVDFTAALGRVSIVEVQRAPMRFRYRLVSTRVTEHLGYEMSGKFTDDIPDREMRAFVLGFYARALERAGPLYEAGTAIIDGYRWWHETLALPLASDGETIDMLLIYRNTKPPIEVGPAYRTA
jgi:hypothetical protein